MTIGVFVSTFQPVLKNDGSINAGGVLHFYEPGESGSTYKVVYSDKDLTTSAGSQVTLDSGAQAAIYLNGDYDLIIKDSAGNTVRTISNINPDQTTTTTDINLISNGSFETNTSNVPTDWTLFEWNIGANVVDNSAGNFADGAYSMKFVSTGSGGGTLTTNSFFTVNEGATYIVDFSLKSSDAGVRNIIQFLWYDEDQVALGTPSTSVYDEATANPTSWARYSKSTLSPSGARFGKLKIIGCDSSDATSGTTWIDGVIVTSPTILTEGASVASASSCDIWLDDGYSRHITGTTQIDNFATAPVAGLWQKLIFDDAVILNHSSNLNLPGAVDFTTAAGMVVFVYADTTTQMDVFPINSGVNIQTFNSSGTWTKPTGYHSGSRVHVQLWGGGGSGAVDSAGATAGGGGGGSYKEAWFILSSLSATVSVTVGAGGAQAGTDPSNGSNGGSSSFGSLITAYGGSGGNSAANGGAAGGVFATAAAGTQTNDWNGYTQEGGGGDATNAAASGYFIGGGGGGCTGTASSNAGGRSVYGGGGGGGTGSGAANSSGGTSMYGGAGGGGVTGGQAGVAGTAPGGGGGGTTSGPNSGAGAAGRVIVTVFP